MDPFHDIIDERYQRIGKRTTICLATMRNGFEVVGTSCCVRDDEFNEELGRQFAREDARRRVEEYIAYAQREADHTQGTQ